MLLNALAPFVSSAADPFDRRKAAHLLRRAGWGAAPAAVTAAVDQGLEATVEDLFDEAADEDAEFEKTFAAVGGHLMNFAEPEGARAWWAYRMLRTRAPLREKLALFWHGHFATSIEKVEDTQLMLQQVATFRRLAWGNFRDLTQAVAKDPAMLVWLDGESSAKDHPNENFGRELMELFTCGIGHYTETDVQEAARAFTGWRREGSAFRFDAEAHDAGRKRFLGKAGKFDGPDIIDILMQQPATLLFLGRKLLRFFATPDPTEELVAEAAALLEHTRLDVKWFLRALFLSRWFYSAACHRQRISSPAEYVVGTLRALDVRWPATQAVDVMEAMGQALLAPPNVKGWDGERKWINSDHWAARLDFAKTISELASDNALAPNLDIHRVVAAEVSEPAKAIDLLAEALFQGELPDSNRQALTDFLVTTPEGRNADAFRDDGDFRTQKTREALGLMLSLPEYHAY